MIPWIPLVVKATTNLDFSRILKEGTKEKRLVCLQEELFRMRVVSPNFYSAELGT